METLREGQSLFILSEGYIFARIGSQGLGAYYILSDDGFFIEEKRALRIFLCMGKETASL